MGYNIIAPFNEYQEAIYMGIKDFPTNRLFLLCPKRKVPAAEKVKRDLLKFNIVVKIHPIEGHTWEEIFRVVSEIASQYPTNSIMVNIGAGDRTTRCAATSAAFVNGLKAFDVIRKTTMVLPVLKFSYYRLLTDKKITLLKILFQNQGELSFESLGKQAKIGSPLLSYHLNGTLKSEGLKQLGLVDMTTEKKRLRIRLTMLGKLLIKGYVQ